jgi:hypothetical protein
MQKPYVRPQLKKLGLLRDVTKTVYSVDLNQPA